MTGKKGKASSELHIGGNVNVSHGDFVAGDKRVKVEKGGVMVGGNASGNIVTGDHNKVGNQETIREDLFKELIKKIEKRPKTSPEDKEDLKVNVAEIKAEAAKGDKADESFLSRRLRNIERIAPDIADVVLTTIANPTAGFALIVKKVAERARTPASESST
jgi:hypothetical protein